MTIDAVRLPVEVEKGATGGPGFKTSVIPVGSGKEQRNAEWEQARGRWDLSYGFTQREYYATLIAFFRARFGKHRGFLFKDWSDYRAEDPQELGTGNGTNTDFQLVVIYPDPVNPYTRRISRPIDSTVKVFLDAVEQTITTDYTIESGGIIRFVTPPAGGEVVTATFEFDVPVRFDTDQLNITVAWEEAAAFPELPIVEDRDDD